MPFFFMNPTLARRAALRHAQRVHCRRAVPRGVRAAARYPQGARRCALQRARGCGLLAPHRRHRERRDRHRAALDVRDNLDRHACHESREAQII